MYTKDVIAMRPGAVSASAKPLRTNLARTPANRALTRATGMRFMNRSKGPENPTNAISTPLMTKAPTASESVKSPGATVARIAAPGAENATITGMRNFSEGTMVRIAIPRQRANTHEAICLSLAPTALAASKTITMPLVKPTSEATNPAVIVDSEKSLKICT